MDAAKVRGPGGYLFGGATVQFVRLPVAGERLALSPQAQVIGVLHGGLAGGVPAVEVFVQPLAAGASPMPSSSDHIDPGS